MPAILTHDLFARGVIDDVRSVLPLSTGGERDAFRLGSQGPDPLFFLVIDPLMRRYSPLGDAMHEARPARLLVSMSEGARRLQGREQEFARAYVAGFACHYLLDSTVHPFVFAWQHDLCGAGVEGLDDSAGGRVHAEIERDLDEAVLFARRGETIRDYRPFERSLPGSAEVLRTIDKVYFYAALWTYGETVDTATFSAAVRCYRAVMGLIYSPGGKRRHALGSLERLATRTHYPLGVALSHRCRPEATSDFDNRSHARWTDPFTGATSTASFWDLLDDAAARVVPAVEQVVSPRFDAAAASRLTGDLNFSGELAPLDGPLGAW